jgi:hypothetical protein
MGGVARTGPVHIEISLTAKGFIVDIYPFSNK